MNGHVAGFGLLSIGSFLLSAATLIGHPVLAGLPFGMAGCFAAAAVALAWK